MEAARSPLPSSDALRPASATPQRNNFKHDAFHAGARAESTIEKMWARVLKSGGYVGVAGLFTMLVDCLLLITHLGGQAHHPFTIAMLKSLFAFGTFGYVTWLRKEWGEMGLPEAGTLSTANSALVIRDLYRYRTLLAVNAGFCCIYFFVLTMTSPDKYLPPDPITGEIVSETKVSVFYVFLLLLAFVEGMYSAVQSVKVSRLRDTYNGEWDTARAATSATDIEWEPGALPSTPPQSRPVTA